MDDGWMDRCTDEQNVSYTSTQCADSAFKRKDLLTPATTQVSLEDIALGEIRQSQDKH